MAHAPITASSEGTGREFELVPPGTHFAICIRVVYVGIQKVTFDGQTKEQPKVRFDFEVPEIQIEYEKNGQITKGPAVIGRTFTLNIGSKSNLGPFIENWRGRPFTDEEAKEFDVTSLLGKVCNLGVIHEEKKGGKVFANITSAGKILKIQEDAIRSGQLSAVPHNKPYSYNADVYDKEVFDKLPKFLRRMIEERVIPQPKQKSEPRQQQLPKGYEPIGKDDFDDDIPF